METQFVSERDAQSKSRTAQREGKYLIFRLGGEEFGIRVLKVREIMGCQDITPIPQTSAAVKGVINLRGKVVPVVELRVKFGMPEIAYTARTCIIVVEAPERSGSQLIGAIVDDVVEVLTVAAGDVEDTPDFGDGVSRPYLVGMAKVKGKVKILLDIDQVLSGRDLMATSVFASQAEEALV